MGDQLRVEDRMSWPDRGGPRAARPVVDGPPVGPCSCGRLELATSVHVALEDPPARYARGCSDGCAFSSEPPRRGWRNRVLDRFEALRTERGDPRSLFLGTATGQWMEHIDARDGGPLHCACGRLATRIGDYWPSNGAGRILICDDDACLDADHYLITARLRAPGEA